MSDVTQTRTAESVLERLERLLAAATPGPWRIDERIGVVQVYPGPWRNCLAAPDDPTERTVLSKPGRWTDDRWTNDPLDVADAAYIAAADPTTVSALVAVARAAGDILQSNDNGDDEDGWGYGMARLRSALARLSGTVE